MVTRTLEKVEANVPLKLFVTSCDDYNLMAGNISQHFYATSINWYIIALSCKLSPDREVYDSN